MTRSKDADLLERMGFKKLSLAVRFGLMRPRKALIMAAQDTRVSSFNRQVLVMALEGTDYVFCGGGK